MQIREFDRRDSKSLLHLWEVCGLTVPWNDPLKDIERKMSVQPELFLIGVAGEKVIASVMGGYDGHRGWIYYLAVHPDHRRRGYGTDILAEIERKLYDMGCPKINLMVRAANRQIGEYYLKLGYSVEDVASLGKRLVQD
jgi:ribosomal protein S18 acetylase RimI-like enzyme